jgi:hypothetical protein
MYLRLFVSFKLNFPVFLKDVQKDMQEDVGTLDILGSLLSDRSSLPTPSLGHT